MKDQTILLLAYYYHEEDSRHKLVRHITSSYCPAYWPFRLFGPGSSGHVTFQEMLDIFASSKINLNLAMAAGHPVLQTKGRVFQACLAGCFVLTDATPGLEKYFQIGGNRVLRYGLVSCQVNSQSLYLCSLSFSA